MTRSIRRYLRKLWESHGGGFYGFVAALMFLYLEGVDIAGDFAAAGELELLELSWWIRMAVDNFVDALLNSIFAAIWPVTWIERFGVGLQSAALLGIAYLVYLAVRPSVQRLLREPAEPESAPAARVQAGS